MTITRDSKKFIEVLGRKIAYYETGKGKPIVFQHGNPTSSFLWRNVIPHLEDHGRCIALDLVGMGDSEKLEGSSDSSYSFLEHYEYFRLALERLGVERDVTFVLHDWGSALGFHWANMHQESVEAICYMEAIVRPVSWQEFPDSARDIFQGFRSQAGEEMVLRKNLFVEAVLPGSILRKLTDIEMDEYRRPFLEEGEARRPTLSWPRQIPIEGEPREVVEIAESYSAWLAQSPVKKLFVNADPGALLTGSVREFCRSWPNQTEITVKGTHFIQEDSPDEIGLAIRSWLEGELS